MTSLYAPGPKPLGGKAASLTVNEKQPKIPKATPKKVPLPPLLGGPGAFKPTPKTVKAAQKAVPKAAPVKNTQSLGKAPAKPTFKQATQSVAAAKTRLKQQYPNLPDWAYQQAAVKSLKAGPTMDPSVLTPAQIARAARVGARPTVAMNVLNSTVHPVTDLAQQVAGQRPFKPGGALSDVANIASNFIPAGKIGAAGLFGARALKGAKVAEDVGTTVVPDVAKVAEAALTPEQQLRSALKGLKVARGKQEAGYSVARSKVSAQIDTHFANQSLTPSERLDAAHTAMRGELPKVISGGTLREMPQESLDHLLGTVMNHPNLKPFQKATLSDALVGVIREGITPTTGELSLMRHVWGRDMTASIQDMASNWRKGVNAGLGVVNIPRSIMSSIDASFGGRQGMVTAFYNPKIWYKNFSHSLSYLNKYTGSGEAGYQELIARAHESPNFPMYQDMGLAITDLEHEVGMREEPFQSNLAEKFTIGRNAEGKIRPGVEGGHGPGNLIRGSGRAYTGAAVGMRTMLADHLLEQATNAGHNVQNEQLLHQLGHFINTITGRGDLPGRVLQESAPLLNSLFFSPRLLAARIQMMNPRNYLPGLGVHPFVRRQYQKAALRTFGSLTMVLGAIKQFVPGAQVGIDPRSSDFGKIKIGDTRIDLGAGFNQVIHLAGEVYTGQKKSTTTGKVTSLTSNKFGQMTRADAITSFLSGKLAPIPRLASDWAHNKNPSHFGRPFSWADEGKTLFQPLAIQDAWNTYTDPVKGVGGLGSGVAGYGLSGLGVGVQTYGNQKTKGKGKGNPYSGSSSSGGSPYSASYGSSSSPYAP